MGNNKDFIAFFYTHCAASLHLEVFFCAVQMDLCQSVVHPLDGALNLVRDVIGALHPNVLKLLAAAQLLAGLAV
jgi:hypothetical protein